MQAAIRLLTYERRWLSQAWELAEGELEASVDDVTKALVSAQMDRLSLDICEVTDALEVLNTLEVQRHRRLDRAATKVRAKRHAAAES